VAERLRRRFARLPFSFPKRKVYRTPKKRYTNSIG